MQKVQRIRAETLCVFRISLSQSFYCSEMTIHATYSHSYRSEFDE
jgi:hypothetical protein